MSHVNKKHGFTLIELMLAMGFVSVLLIAVAMTVMQIANIYNRGVTLKDVNQAGRSLVSELQRSINGNVRFNLADSKHYVSQDWGGRLCLGQYSFIWNYGVAISNTQTHPLNSSRNVYANSAVQLPEIRFIKILDPTDDYCVHPNRTIDPVGAVELLDAGEHSLAIHKFSITTTDGATDMKTQQQLYNISFVIGTNDQDALNDDPKLIKVCKAPNEAGSDVAYCSITQFNTLARAGNSAK